MAKKSLYLSLTGLLGIFLFFVLHRIVIFLYLYMLAGSYIVTDMNYLQFLALDYISLFITLIFGAWYGVWVGMHWFERVYVSKNYNGFIQHLSGALFSSTKTEKLESKIAKVKERLETDMWELEDLAKVRLEETPKPKPIKRRVVRKTAPKKLKSAK